MYVKVVCPKSKCLEIIDVEVEESIFNGKEITCSKGHTFELFSPYTRYNILLNQAMIAFKKGFYFESFHTLYSGYENFKFIIVQYYLFTIYNDIEKAIEVSKKMNRSEKIDGAFTIAYISIFNESPNTLSNNLIKERNNVTHNGKIPTKKMCENLGNSIFKLVISTHSKLNIDFDGTLLIEFLFFLNQFNAKEKGHAVIFETPNEFYNKKYSTDGILGSSLSPNTQIPLDEISNSLFLDIISKETIENYQF